MKKIYDRDVLKQINENVNLLEYVGNSLEFTKKSKDYWAHCPLHIDKTPSFSITPDKNTFYCFSCGKSGYIINYLIYYENLSFEKAVEKAAKLANLDLSKMCKSETVAFLKQIKANKLNTNSYCEHRILDKREIDKFLCEPATEWIAEGIRQEVLKLFDIRIDKWSNRIVYPVYDIDGNFINIKGRTRYENFKELGLAKYINYFPVGTMDYFQGLNITIEYIKQKNEIIIFESLKSVMKAYGWGYKNCVSAEKHTLTKEQINLLIKLKVNIIFAYDSDVDYYSKDVKQNIDKLKRITNVFLIRDFHKELGGKEAKNAPVDCGREIWERLYADKQKVV